MPANAKTASVPASSHPDGGQLFDSILAGDSHPVPDFVAQQSGQSQGSESIAVSRYTSPAFFQLELEKMWPRVWQFAAREEELPEPGDYIVYENAGRSYIVSRQADGSVRAFHNVCLHRGRKLRTENGSTSFFRCPFHGFSWKADGTLDSIPCAWDFSHIERANMSLPEASVGLWGGYIFIRETADGPSLEEFLAPLPAHFKRWRHEDRITAVWVGKVLQANWKVSIEAFLESLHLAATHPQSLFFTADTNSRYDVYGANISRAITPTGVRHHSIDPAVMSDQQFFAKFLSGAARPGSVSDEADLPEGASVRAVVADINRRRYSDLWGLDLSDAADFEMMDAIYYHVFPNFSPWGGFTPTLNYRFRPWPDQNRTLMEVRILSFPPKGALKPPKPIMQMLGDDEPWASAAILGKLGAVLDQDASNLKYVQEGLKASKNGRVELANYQEIRVRQLHQTLDGYVTG